MELLTSTLKCILTQDNIGRHSSILDCPDWDNRQLHIQHGKMSTKPTAKNHKGVYKKCSKKEKTLKNKYQIKV